MSIDYSKVSLLLSKLSTDGYVVFETPSHSCMGTLAELFEDLVGRTLNHYRHSNRSGVVVISQDTYDGVRRPQSTPDVQSPHTDGAFEAEVPMFILMSCVEPAFAGGVSTMVDVSDIYTAIAKESPALLQRLFDPDCYTVIRGDKRKSRAVFERIEVNGRSETICSFSAHEYNEVEVKQDCRDAFALFKQHSLSPLFVKQLSLCANQSVLINNYRMLHGRSAWVDSAANTRRLERTWHNGKSPFLNDFRFGLRI